jgi:uncharacterized membrane protein
MVNLALTPISATVLFILLAVAVGTLAVSWGGLEIKDHVETAKITDQSFCSPADALKLKFINKDITQEEYENMKATIEGG